MATLKFTDRYQSTLASGYTAGGTSLSVTSATGLPSSGDFYVVVATEASNTEEIFKVTAISGTTLTVIGAQAGTSASNHGSGAAIRATLMTAAAFTQMKQDIVSAMSAAAFNTETTNGSLNPEGRRMVVLTDEDTLCLWDGTIWKFDLSTYATAAGGIRLADYTWTNQGAATATERSLVAGGVILTVPAVGGTNWRILKKAVPTTPWTATLTMVGNSGGGARTGLVLIDNGGKLVSWGPSGDGARSLDNWNSVTSWSSGGNPFTWTAGLMLQVRIVHTGTNLEFYKKLATDGVFVGVVTTSATAWLSSTLVSIGFGTDGEGANLTNTFYTLSIT
jgi:hypothetical protein